MNIHELLALSRPLQEQLITWRRDFHRHPETGYEEIRTSGIVAEHLRSLGLEVTTQVGKTGVVALLRGKSPGPTIGLRADMDALPIQDQKTVPYRSEIPGKAHLCGHDAHTAILMGTAQLLAHLERPERGNIKFVFQPAEEGLAGAKAMIDDGVLENPKVDAMAGLHMFPGLKTGTLGVSKGVAFASADSLTIKILGKGGHAARPHEGIDAIAVSAQVISALQNISSRMVDPLETMVITIGKISGGYMGAAIAPEVEMIGTVRTLSAELRNRMPELIEQVVRGVCESFGAGYELSYQQGYPVVQNDPDMVDLMTETSEQLFGSKEWDYIKPSTGGEDFAFYCEQVPGVFFRLGCGRGDEDTSYPLHHPRFDLDEMVLPYGVAMMSAIALNFLKTT
ncbi:putative hydrolase YxeP [Paenibacillus polymyxa]|jgi:amidohydrolase|uniref:M20 metallopeptidase family protein n=1 Tax=Paenibacillus TaxID=44249 RepID=UPI00048AC3E6|nr:MULTISPECIES: M20 family metallopeptidase [Paenibacillus]APQ61294.1 amidohydrolase [Paenibacillus polymyxa]MBP1173148.1 amidohydrolase [Paenibacillus sp. PvR133]MXO77777.1 amidohydrolase [Paenibacillus sp. OT2-17]OMF70590.1 amidohydrolase [Paenibacillus peoriae]SFR24527.1 amidohydrolase [Paenibacillus sp. cl130]